MKNKKLVWLRLLIFLPLLFMLIFVNIYFDPADVFHNMGEAVADSLMSGNPTYIASGNLNERYMRMRMIETMPDEVDCIAVGPSIVLGVRGEHAGTEEFYNLGQSGADFYDIMAEFALMEINGKKTDRVIFCVDSYFFNEALYESFVRNVSLKPYSYYMMDILDGKTPELPKKDTEAEDIQKVKQMFSISYFQSAIEFVRSKGTLDIQRYGTPDASYDGSYYLPDGSLVYPESYENTSVDVVINDAQNYIMDYQFSKYVHISPKSMEYFEKLLVYLEQQGTEVVLFLCPLCPTLWDRYDENVYPILPEVESFVLEMAEKYDLKVTGSYNPYNVNVSDEEFYDARHMRHDVLEKYFDFVDGTR